MKDSGLKSVRRWLLIAVAAYLLGGVLYVAAGAWKQRSEPRFDAGWAEPFSSLVGVLGWPWMLDGDWKHKVGVFAPDSSARSAPAAITSGPSSPSDSGASAAR